ncbi:MAG: hypothetical protein US52_C0005G0008 [candidate division WS6 bacterium GW2011_GWA2_37_6]|uniref:Lycopene cyclase domain-containing protein n=1 Tax=candidate division WS6 bacterium GW2011_GWA2_37_6 TaxID=1619087 RepID=A0A0G0GZ46_9BACT|nr:MAG: hypothetical protein US52_C0005G0008 [candidate division WS6 bacterium GW2011_GWA2_37_6]
MDITYLREHPYLIGSLYFFGIWIVLFILNKKDKKEQLVFGIIGGVLGVLVEQMHLNDWWRPNFIYDFPIHIEDIFFGIGVMGISSVLYEFLFKKKQKSYSKLRPTKRYKIILFIVAIFSMFGMYILFDVHSFWTSVIATFTVVIFIEIKRPDLTSSMVISGLLMVLIALPSYWIGLTLQPNAIDSDWVNSKLSGYQIIGLPIEEYIWFFLVGFGSSALWELAKGTKFYSSKKRAKK